MLRILIIFFVIFGPCHALLGDVATSRPSSLPSSDDLSSLLDEAGRSLDLYFTIERNMDVKDDKVIQLYGKLNSKHAPFSNFEEFKKYMKNEFPNLDVVVDSRQSKIIHLVDLSLSRSDPYIMSQKLDLDFSGTPDALLGELSHRTEGRLLAKEAIAPVIFVDSISKLSISEKNLTIRTVLSAFLPLQSYSRILWSSDTQANKDGAKITRMEFYGPERH